MREFNFISAPRGWSVRTAAPAVALLAALALTAGTGCGNDNSDNEAQAEDIELTRTRAEAVGFALTQIVFDSTAGVITEPTQFAQTLEAGAATEEFSGKCSPEADPKNPNDADDNGIPESQTFTFDCELALGDENDENGPSLALNGNVDIRDKDDDDASAGFTFNMPALVFSDNAGQTVTYTVNADATPREDEEEVEIQFQNTISTNAENPLLRRLTWDDTITLRPDSMDAPYDSGALEFDSELEVEDGQNSGTLRLRSEKLEFTSTGCDGGAGFNGGEIRITDESDNNLVIDTQDCDYQLTYNDETIGGDPVDPALMPFQFPKLATILQKVAGLGRR